METAGEGGAWGMAVLSKYSVDNSLSLDEYLNDKVFKNAKSKIVEPNTDDVEGFKTYMIRYKAALKAEIEAYKNL